MLVLNDHVLKGRLAGWWTGKVSDVAGVAVVGVLASVLIGPRPGLPLVAALFVLLKTVPGVAELASPVLGGVTLRDATDLLALAVLVPLWRLLEASEPASGSSSRTERQASGWRHLRDRCRTALSACAPLVGGIVAVTSATATSCSPAPAVTQVAADGQALYALVSAGWSSRQWARSTDGGHSWHRSESPSTAQMPRRTSGLYQDPVPAGPVQACAFEGTCWRLRDRRVIERGSDTSGWVEEVRLSDAEFSAISTGCTGGSMGVLGSVAATDGRAGPQVVASLGADGVIVREAEGRWDRVRVLSAPPIEATPIEAAASGAVLYFGPVLALVVWLVGRQRWPSWRTGLAVAGLGWFTTFLAAAVIRFNAGSGTDPARPSGRFAIAGMAITSVASVLVSRLPVRPRRMTPPSAPPPRPPLGAPRPPAP